MKHGSIVCKSLLGVPQVCFEKSSRYNSRAKTKSRTMLCWFVAAFVVTCAGGEAVSQTDFWQKTNPPFGRTVGSVASKASRDIFAGTDAGVFRSTDNGGTWTESNSGLNPDTGYSVFTSSGSIFAWGNTGYYRTTDNGSNWTQFTHVGGFRTNVAINDSGYIFVGWGNESGGAVERSTDSGANWIHASFTSTDVSALAISSSGNIFAGTSGKGICRSTDNGASWIHTSLTSPYVSALTINASGNIFAGTSDGTFAGTSSEGVFRSVHPTTSVQEVSAGMPETYSLDQNYPNPFNPATSIRFSIPRLSTVTLKAFNTVGEEVASRVSQNLPAGKYSYV